MKNINKLTSAILLASAISAPALAELSTNIAATSDYVWRGVSQTGNGAAVQGGIDFASDSGFFTGAWLSNTSFGSNEVDLYFGYGGEAGDFGYSAMFNYYYYPSIESDSNFGEIMLDFSWSALSFGVATTVVSELDDAAGDFFVEGDLHYYVGVGGDVGEGWSLSATYGIYDFDNNGSDADAVDGMDTSYGYIDLSAAKDVGDFGEVAFGLSIADEEAREVAGNADADEPNLRVSWSKSF